MYVSPTFCHLIVIKKKLIEKIHIKIYIVIPNHLIMDSELKDFAIETNYAQIILFLRECFNIFFGEYYPHELIKYIIVLSHNITQIYCADTVTFFIQNKKYMSWVNLYGKGDAQHGDDDECLRNPKLPKFVYYSGNGKSFLALTNDDDMYAWGFNVCGQFGLGDTLSIDCPQKILSNIKIICCGWSSVFAVSKSDKVYVCGNNCFGQLGLGDDKNRHFIQEINLLEVIMIKCWAVSTIFLLKCGKIYTCGRNQHGQLGLGHNDDCHIPNKLELYNIIAVDNGYAHTVALSKYCQLFVWGFNTNGELGLGDRIDRNSPHELLLNDVISINCGFHSTVALTKYGDMYSWGDNYSGALGLSNKLKYVLSPQKICIIESPQRSPNSQDRAKIISINSGAYYTFAIDVYGGIYFWGENKINVYEPQRFLFC